MRKFLQNPDRFLIKIGLTTLVAIELFKFIKYVVTH
jgi:hypothetical protein